MDFAYPIIALLVIVVIVLVILYLSVRVVQPHEKMVVFRLGRTNQRLVRDPGRHFLIPVIDRSWKVDLREQVTELFGRTMSTRDDAQLTVDLLIRWRITDPLKSVTNVAFFEGALQGVATTTLRAVIGDMLLREALVGREALAGVLWTKLDDVAHRWGGTVSEIDILDIRGE